MIDSAHTFDDVAPFFASVLEHDSEAVVICDLDHTIIYMNPAAAAAQAHRGGYDLLGKSLLACHSAESRERINQVVAWFAQSADNNRVHTFYNPKKNRDFYMVALRDATGKLIGYYEKHETRTVDDSKRYDLS